MKLYLCVNGSVDSVPTVHQNLQCTSLQVGLSYSYTQCVHTYGIPPIQKLKINRKARLFVAFGLVGLLQTVISNSEPSQPTTTYVGGSSLFVLSNRI